MKIAIIISDFNREITSIMEKAAESTAKKLNVKIAKKIHVPGSFEIPFAADHIFSKEKIDALVVLGAVIEGETHHDIIIVSTIAQKLIDVSLKYKKPIGFGVIGPRVTWNQAESRAEEYAQRAVETVFQMIKLIKK